METVTNNDYRTRTIKTPDKIQITFFDNKFHSNRST